jgi:hypothetical protein
MNKKGLKFKALLIVIALLVIVVLAYLLVSKDKENNNEKETFRTQNVGAEAIKENVIGLIPEKYEVVEKDSESMYFLEEGKCIFLYEIYPKEYSEIEREYLENASVIYCEDINTTVLRGQTEEVQYDQTEKKWLFKADGRLDNSLPLDVKQFGNNLVSIAPLGGSHASRNYYIVKKDISDELVILSIPTWSRIRCDFLEEGVEKQNCEKYLDSIWTDRAFFTDHVPEEVYENYYNELLIILLKNL